MAWVGQGCLATGKFERGYIVVSRRPEPCISARLARSIASGYKGLATRD